MNQRMLRCLAVFGFVGLLTLTPLVALGAPGGAGGDNPVPVLVGAAQAITPTLLSFSPARNVITASLTASITARYDQPLAAASVTSRTFVVYGMQSGVVTQGHGLADVQTLQVSPARPFHQGELVYVVATTGTTNLSGTHPLSSTQWQFNAGVIGPRCVSGFYDIGAGLPGTRWGSVAWGDYDADDDLDLLIVGSYTARIYRNTGGSFSDIGAGLPGIAYGRGVWGDYDNDGDLDLFLTGGYTSRLYQNTGFGFNQVYTDSFITVDNGRAAWGDYDNDGDLDLLLAGNAGTFSAPNPVARIYQNTGNGFSEVYAGSLTGAYYGGVAWGDYDNDGDLDILLTGNRGTMAAPNPTSKVYQNTGNGFSEVYAGSLPGAYMNSAAWGDYDNDGDLDILLAGNVSRLYQNTGNGFSQVYTGSLTSANLGGAAWGDYDNDGDLDILLSGEMPDSNDITRVYRNTGSGFSDIGAGLAGTVLGDLAWGDYDNDGDLDIALTGDSNNTPITRIYRNDDCLADLTLTKSVLPTTATPGQTITYTVKFNNSGLGLAKNVVLTDAIPLTLLAPNVSSSGAAITLTGGLPYAWQIQDLASGQGGIITITGRISPTVTGTVLTNTAVITTATPEVSAANNAAQAVLTLAYPLVVVKAGSGTGTVTSVPAGITCGANCSAAYGYGAVVTLTATPAPGATFTGWSGALSGSTNPQTLTLTGNATVTAAFALSCQAVTGAAFTFAPLQPLIGQAVWFTGTVAAGSGPLTYTWAWGDGSPAGLGATLSHAFPLTATQQTYTVTMAVSNACSGPVHVAQTLTVTPRQVFLPLVLRQQ